MKNQIIKRIDKENFENVKHLLTSTTKPDVTGGMLGKVQELLRVENITSEIIGGTPGIIKRALKGESGLGTLIVS